MTSFAFSSWFRRRMLPLVIGVSLVGACASPGVYYARKRHELVSSARAEADRVAGVLTEAVLQRPRLWRYDTSKIAERLSSEGIGQQGALVVHDSQGVRVPIRDAPLGEDWLWAQAAVVALGQKEATIWVGTSSRPLHRGTATLGAVSALLSLLLGVLLYLIPTRAIAAAERRIDALVRQLSLTLREEERGRIARDLHDGAGQALTAARLHLVALRKSANTEAMTGRVASVAHHIDDALEEIRRSTAALRPPALAELGLRGALLRHGEAVAAAAGLAVSWKIDLPHQLSAHVETTLYRIIQESLTNAARHAEATQVEIQIQVEGDRLTLGVEDNGRGLGQERPQGVGLDSIVERARLLGGEARFIDRSPGLRVEVVLPLEET